MIKTTLLIMGVIMAAAANSPAQKLETIKLNPPRLEESKSLMQCLKERRSIREYSEKEISLQVLSDLLWAANGINRPEEKKCTAPSAMNRQEIDIYVMLKTGVYLYDPEGNALLPVNSGDHRKLAGMQEFARSAPLTLFLVSDLAKLKGEKQMQEKFSGINAGYVSQNIYLYCASAGLGTVARASVDKTALAEVLKLKPGQEILLAHSVGYQKEKK